MNTANEHADQIEGLPASVVICTRDRGDSVSATIESLLSNDWPDFELLVIDQSSDGRTRGCVRGFADPRLRYVGTATRGLSIARNLGLAEAKHDVAIMTDDDCVVASNFVRIMIEEMQADSAVTLVFADVLEPTEPSEVWTPINRAQNSYSVTKVKEWKSNDGVNVGIGAAMAVRSNAVVQMGGFDELLGAGALFRSAEDTDLALRILLAGGRIRRTTRTWVYHHGSRSIEETRGHIQSGMFAIGAVCGKLIRSGNSNVVGYLWTVFRATVLVSGFDEVKRGRRPPVLRRAAQLARGIMAGARHPTVGPHLLFDPQHRR